MSYVLEASYMHGAGVRLLRTDDDIDGFLSELLDARADYQSATVYVVDEDTDEDPEHELVVGVDQATALGAVRYAVMTASGSARESGSTLTACATCTTERRTSSRLTQKCRSTWCGRPCASCWRTRERGPRA